MTEMDHMNSYAQRNRGKKRPQNSSFKENPAKYQMDNNFQRQQYGGNRQSYRGMKRGRGRGGFQPSDRRGGRGRFRGSGRGGRGRGNYRNSPQQSHTNFPFSNSGNFGNRFAKKESSIKRKCTKIPLHVKSDSDPKQELLEILKCCEDVENVKNVRIRICKENLNSLIEDMASKYFHRSMNILFPHPLKKSVNKRIKKDDLEKVRESFGGQKILYDRGELVTIIFETEEEAKSACEKEVEIEGIEGPLVLKTFFSSMKDHAPSDINLHPLDKISVKLDVHQNANVKEDLKKIVEEFDPFLCRQLKVAVSEDKVEEMIETIKKYNLNVETSFKKHMIENMKKRYVYLHKNDEDSRNKARDFFGAKYIFGFAENPMKKCTLTFETEESAKAADELELDVEGEETTIKTHPFKALVRKKINIFHKPSKEESTKMETKNGESVEPSKPMSIKVKTEVDEADDDDDDEEEEEEEEEDDNDDEDNDDDEDDDEDDE